MMGKLCFFLLALFVLPVTAQQFPAVRGTLLDGTHATLPAKNGKYSLIAIAFHRDAEDALKKWLQPLYDNFIQKGEAGDPFDMAEFHDVNFVFIPMIQGFRKVAEEFKANTDEHYWPYILDTEKTDIRSLQQQLGVKDHKQPHFYVVDPGGNVVAETQGMFSEQKLEKLEDAIE
jgi:hypothetical protein